jgi:hypothetical protein
MKRFILVIISILVIVSGAYAQQSTTATSSGAFTTSQVIVARAARLVDVGVQTTGAADVTVLLYDNASAASGKVIAFVFVPSGSKVGGWDCPVPSMATNGLYASVTGTGVTRVLVSFDPQ